MYKFSREELERHLNIILKYDINNIPTKYRNEYINKVPTKLYKYRSFKNIHLEAIEEDYIWISLAKDFPDKSDTTINYNFKKQSQKIKNDFEELMLELIFNELKKELTRGGKVNPSVFKNSTLEEAINWLKEYTYKSGRFNYAKTRSYLKSNKVPEKNIKKFEKQTKLMMSKDNIQMIADDFINDLSGINDRFREIYYIHSFSLINNNSYLWDTYTNNDEGFCIEYDLSNNKEELINLFPILYVPIEDINMEQLIRTAIKKHLKKINKSEELELFVKVFSHLLTKNKNYETENEWRLILNKNNIKQNKYNFPFISAIYLGSNMKEQNRRRLINLANKKGIKIYQRTRNKYNTDYEFKLLK